MKAGVAWHQGFARALAEICRTYGDYSAVRNVMAASGITLVALESWGADPRDVDAIRPAFASHRSPDSGNEDRP